MLETLKLYTADLELGMFVSSLDKSWLESSFLIQGFRIEAREQLDRLREECEFVLIDTKQSRQLAGAKSGIIGSLEIRIDRNAPGYPLSVSSKGAPSSPTRTTPNSLMNILMRSLPWMPYLATSVKSLRKLAKAAKSTSSNCANQWSR